jgi:hypothetical protein
MTIGPPGLTVTVPDEALGGGEGTEAVVPVACGAPGLLPAWPALATTPPEAEPLVTEGAGSADAPEDPSAPCPDDVGETGATAPPQPIEPNATASAHAMGSDPALNMTPSKARIVLGGPGRLGQRPRNRRPHVHERRDGRGLDANGREHRLAEGTKGIEG